MYIILFFIFGLLIGSFLNVVIIRIPEGKTIIYGRSSCPNCGYVLKAYDLVPVASFLLLQGKCRKCKMRISRQYPFVELVTGILFAFAYHKVGFNIRLLESLLFVSLSIAVTFTDIKYLRIPNKIVLFGILTVIPFLIYKGELLNASLGFLVGGGILFLLAIITRGGMGGGDIKLAAMQGLYLGVSNMVLTLFLAFISSGFISLFLILIRIRSRKDMIPFGPFLAIAGLVSYFYGSEILTWYFARF